MNILYISIAAVSGLLIPLQALINSRLGGQIGGSLWAAAVSFVVGTVALLSLLLITRQPIPSFTAAVQNLPAWAWCGGLFGAFYVATAAFTVKPLGTSTMIALIIAGQIIGALILEHFGILQTAVPITPIKILGAILLFVGTMMIMNK